MFVQQRELCVQHASRTERAARWCRCRCSSSAATRQRRQPLMHVARAKQRQCMAVKKIQYRERFPLLLNFLPWTLLALEPTSSCHKHMCLCGGLQVHAYAARCQLATSGHTPLRVPRSPGSPCSAIQQIILAEKQSRRAFRDRTTFCAFSEARATKHLPGARQDLKNEPKP